MPIIFLLGLILVAGYFFPVSFHLTFAHSAAETGARLEMSFLHGLVRIGRDFSADGTSKDTDRSGSRPAPKTNRSGLDSDRIAEVLARLDNYGLGGTLFSYILPPGYGRLLNVARRLEKKGRFSSLVWRTTIGFEEAAVTAWAVGAGWIVKTSLCLFLARRYRLPGSAVHLDLRPVFGAFHFATMFDCIFNVRLGQIIGASLGGFIQAKPQRSVSPQ